MEFSLLIFVSLQSLPNSSWDLKIPPLSMKTGHIVLLGEKKKVIKYRLVVRKM